MVVKRRLTVAQVSRKAEIRIAQSNWRGMSRRWKLILILGVAVVLGLVVFSPASRSSRYILLGDSKLVDGDYLSAESHYNEALDLNSDSWLAHLRLGLLHQINGNPQAAIPHFKSARELGGDRPIILENIAYFLLRYGHPQEAEVVLESLLKEAPDRLTAFFLQASAAKMQGDNEKAIFWLQKVLEYNPRFAEAHMQLALLWSDSDPGKAIVACRNVLSFGPSPQQEATASALLERLEGTQHTK